jgi:hypothetical protein
VWDETYRYFDAAWSRVADELATFAETGKKP